MKTSPLTHHRISRPRRAPSGSWAIPTSATPEASAIRAAPSATVGRDGPPPDRGLERRRPPLPTTVVHLGDIEWGHTPERTAQIFAALPGKNALGRRKPRPPQGDVAPLG